MHAFQFFTPKFSFNPIFHQLFAGLSYLSLKFTLSETLEKNKRNSTSIMTWDNFHADA